FGGWTMQNKKPVDVVTGGVLIAIEGGPLASDRAVVHRTLRSQRCQTSGIVGRLLMSRGSNPVSCQPQQHQGRLVRSVSGWRWTSREPRRSRLQRRAPRRLGTTRPGAYLFLPQRSLGGFSYVPQPYAKPLLNGRRSSTRPLVRPRASRPQVAGPPMNVSVTRT